MPLSCIYILCFMLISGDRMWTLHVRRGPAPFVWFVYEVSQDRFCITADTCELCKDLDKATWRRIMDTRRRRNSRIKQQNLTFGESSAIPFTDPSDSALQGDPPSYGSVAASCVFSVPFAISNSVLRSVVSRESTHIACVDRGWLGKSLKTVLMSPRIRSKNQSVRWHNFRQKIVDRWSNGNWDPRIVWLDC